jgi:hypothetical protein
MPAVVQSESYIPATDWAFKSWLQNFSSLISADPGKYGLSAADASIASNSRRRVMTYSFHSVSTERYSTRTGGDFACETQSRASRILMFAMRISRISSARRAG